MQRSHQTKACFTRLCQIGAVLLAVPILLAIGCPLTVTVTCPSAGEAGTDATVTVSVDFGQGAATWTTDATNGTVADGATASPSVTPTAAGTVTVTATATDEAGTEAMDSCTFEATAEPCTDDTDCDDGLFCNGAETCDTDAGSCVAGTDQCTGDGESCDEANDACILACDTDADCDDGDACTTDTCVSGACEYATVDCDDLDACTDDSCDVATGCVNTDVVCDAGETCVDGTCKKDCVSASDCDDSDPCTDDTCVALTCDNTAKDCDDGDFCTGTETCNADTGVCESSGDPCAAGTTCDETSNTCETDVSCDIDADCDDGLFCNGDETCDLTDPLAGICAAGTDPCATDETCNETTNACDAPAGQSFTLTTGTDTGPDFAGGSGDDAYDASLFLTTGGTFVNTINNGDSLDGGGGTDTLTVETTGVTTVAPASLAAIEVVSLEQTTGNPLIFNAVNADALTTVNNRNSATNLGSVTVNNVATVLSNVGWTNGTEAYTVNLTASALSGTGDTCAIDLNGVVDPGDNGSVLTVQPSTVGNGYETFDVTSSGGVANVVQQITDGNGTTLNTVNFLGGVKLTVNAELDGSVTTVNASSTSAGVIIPVNSTGVNTTCTGGTGDDTFDFSGAANDYNTSDIINGGEGTDTLLMDDGDAQVSVAQSNVTNVEVIEVDTAVGGNIDISFFGATKLKLSGAGTLLATTATIPDGGTVEIDVDPAGNATIASKTSGVTNALTMIMDASWTGTCGLATWETVNIEANTVAVTFSGTVILNSSAADETINVTGTQAVTFTGAVTADKIDGSGMTGALTVTATATSSMDITGGSANDSLNGSDSGETINGGDGSDTIEGNDGDDILIGGNDADTFVFEATAALNNNDIINDFTTSDILNFVAFAGDDLPAGTIGDTSTGNQSTADNDIWILTDADGSIDTAAEVAALFGGGGLPFAVGTANADVVLIIQDTQSGGSSSVWYVDNDATAAIIAAECVQVATLANFNGTIADANIAN